MCDDAGAIGRPHPYFVASPGCWAAFGLLQADETTRFGYPPTHGLVVDAYAASHGGDGSERRDRQSVALHLIAIRAVLEQGVTSPARIALLQRLTARKLDWPRLERPHGLPALDHTHLAGAADLEDYTRRAREWAGAVWAFWSPRHGEIDEIAASRS